MYLPGFKNSDLSFLKTNCFWEKWSFGGGGRSREVLRGAPIKTVAICHCLMAKDTFFLRLTVTF